MCINLANEQLQLFFNQSIFAAELASYKAEGIDAVEVFFADNHQVLDVFFRKPLGFFALLDEESNFPQGILF
jgi:myosin heavy subunit